jgi:peptidoglycan/LPS O-acetylase OafA/YrhL
LHYRADIDGLRAIAVVAVVLFHAGLPGFGGGFVGVDVFFVISGFLITALILHEQAAGTFSLAGFYRRRIKRILPALLVMMGACAVAGWFLLAPGDYQGLGRSIASAALSLSNVQFWREVGYFDTPLSEKPLLHTWSLGVEEQFYLVFPLCLLLLARFPLRWRAAVTAMLCLASFAVGMIQLPIDPGAAFFLPQGRMWELLAGSLLAMGAGPARGRPALRAGAALIGLALIAGAILIYDGDTTFPGFAALPPVIGSALVLWSGIGGLSPAGRTLAARPLVFLGNISYSLYLWHFPLLAFGLYVGLGELGAAETAALLALALDLSVLSWRFVEQPARRPGATLGKVSVAALAVCGVFVLAVAGLTVTLKGGLPARMTAESRQMLAGGPLRNPDRSACYLPSAAIEIGKLCALGRAGAAPSFVLWGDSHGEAMRGAVSEAAAAAGRAGVYAGELGCAPLIGMINPQKPSCAAVSDALFRLIAETRSVDTVILVSRWGWWAESLPYKRESGAPVTLALAGLPDAEVANRTALALGLEHTVASLLAAGKRVWLVGPVPEVGYDVPRYFYLRSIGFADGLDVAPTRAEFDRRQAFVLGLFDNLARRYPVGTIWPHQRLCGDDGCAIARDGRLLYADDDHLSVFGARSISGVFAPVFGQISAVR